MNVSLTPELESYIAQKLASGHYRSASEVVSDSLRLMLERDAEVQKEKYVLNLAIAAGLEDVSKGRIITSEQAKECFYKRYKE
jgi:antitoxin ParD1/3/4